jgi:HlyD family secretion protein
MSSFKRKPPGQVAATSRTLNTQTPNAMDRPLAPRSAWRRVAVPVVAVVLVLSVGTWLLSRGRGSIYRAPVNQLTIATVSKGPFEDFIAVRGTVAPLITAFLTTDQGGAVKQVLVEDGAAVKAGQPLIVLSNPALQLQVAAQQLTFEQTRFKYEHDLLDIEHQISTLRGNLERDKILLDGNAIAPSTYKQEQEEYDYLIQLRAATIASRDVEQKVRATQLIGAEAVPSRNPSVDIANAGVDALTIRAPMDGQLSALEAEIGQSKAPGAVLGQVNSADRFKLSAQVDEFYLGRVTSGQDVLFAVSGRNYRAKTAKVYPQVADGTFKVDLYFEGQQPSGIHVGQTIDLKLEVGEPAPAIMLPNGPFYQDTGGNWVFVLSPDGKYAVRRNVHLGRRNPQFVEVIDGLEPGEKVIVSGYEAYQRIDRIELEKTAGSEN